MLICSCMKNLFILQQFIYLLLFPQPKIRLFLHKKKQGLLDQHYIFETSRLVIVYPCNVFVAHSHISGKKVFWVQHYPSTPDYPAIVHLQTIYVLLAVPVIVERD